MKRSARRPELTVHPSVDWAGGGLVSTVSDLAGFVGALSDGGLLGPASLSDMTALEVTESGPGDELLSGLGYLGFRSGSFEMEGPELLELLPPA